MNAATPARIFVTGPAADDPAWAAIALEGQVNLERWASAEAMLLALSGGQKADCVFAGDPPSGLGGLELCRRMRCSPATLAVPLILTAEHPDAVFVHAAFAAGASDVFAQPLDLDRLRARLQGYRAVQLQEQALQKRAETEREELEHLIGDLRRQLDERDRTLSRAEFVFSHDLVTGLPNRRYLIEQLERALRRAENDRLPVALIGIEVDLAERGPVLGAPEQDRLLSAAASHIQQLLRPLDLVARVGQGLFCALLVPCARETLDTLNINAVEAAARTCRALAEDLQLDGQVRPVGARAAVAVYPADGARAADLLQHLESTLTAAGNGLPRDRRRAGPDPALTVDLELRLRRALETQRLVPYYQPKIDSVSGLIVGAEALVRWPLRNGEFVGPSEFVPAAEAGGLVPALDDYVLSAACHQIRLWQDRFSDFRIGVNLSAIKLHHRGVLERLQELFAITGADPRHLELEITESALITDFEAARTWLGTARDLGVTISLDDFGTGYSSLAYLRRLPLDAIKIDRSFVVGLESEGSTVAIVRAMVAMARALGLTIVAEGVENHAQANILIGLGCRVLQGFLYSPAVPAAEFEDMLRVGRLDPGSSRPLRTA